MPGHLSGGASADERTTVTPDGIGHRSAGRVVARRGDGGQRPRLRGGAPHLALRRPDWLPAFDQLLPRVEQVPSALFDLPVTLDEKDRPLMCAAIRAGCAHFATGDRRDFGHLFDKVVEKVLVVRRTDTEINR